MTSDMGAVPDPKNQKILHWTWFSGLQPSTCPSPPWNSFCQGAS